MFAALPIDIRTAAERLRIEADYACGPIQVPKLRDHLGLSAGEQSLFTARRLVIDQIIAHILGEGGGKRQAVGGGSVGKEEAGYKRSAVTPGLVDRHRLNVGCLQDIEQLLDECAWHIVLLSGLLPVIGDNDEGTQATLSVALRSQEKPVVTARKDDEEPTECGQWKLAA